MKTEYTEDGYLKVSADGNESLNYEDIQQMNTTTYILPSFRDRYEKNSILFHKGEYVSFNEYLKIHEMDFAQLQKIILKLIDIYMGVEQSGFQSGNVLPSLDYIFINEKSEDIKIIYIPMITVIEEEGFHALLRAICYGVHTKGSAILLGILLEESNRMKCNLSDFKAEIKAARNVSEIKEVEKVVEKIVEVPVEREKIIEKEIKVADGKILCRAAIITELITGIMLPILLHLLFGNHVAIMPQVSTYLLSAIMIIVLIITNYMIKSTKSELVSSSDDIAEVIKKKDKQDNRKKEVFSENYSMPERKTSKEEKQKKNNTQNVEAEVSKARIVRDNKKDYQKANANYIHQEVDLEGTAVLFGSDPLNEAYIIEEGKTGLMDRIFIDCDKFMIGREQGVNYKIEESSVSKRHAEIRCIGGEYFIRDLNSSNGTFVNNAEIKANIDTKLSDGDRLELGSKKYVFCRK